MTIFTVIDLYLPEKKLKIINIYAHQACNYATKGKQLVKFIKQHITSAEAESFQCIIMGDFNADPFKYHQILERKHTTSPFFNLIEFLTERNYIDQSPKDKKGCSFTTFYANNTATSRVDLIWYPEDMIRDTFCFDQIWHLSCA